MWLPDSRRILFVGLGPNRARDPAHYEPDFKAFVLDRVTKELEQVLEIPGASLDAPALSVDGRKLVVVRVSVDSDIWMLSAQPAEDGPGTGF